jgi:hypothetical protein
MAEIVPNSDHTAIPPTTFESMTANASATARGSPRPIMEQFYSVLCLWRAAAFPNLIERAEIPAVLSAPSVPAASEAFRDGEVLKICRYGATVLGFAGRYRHLYHP